MQNINIEKITAYVMVLGTVYMFWQSQMNIKSEICDVKVRGVANEKDIEFLQGKICQKWDGKLPNVTSGAVPFIELKEEK